MQQSIRLCQSKVKGVNFERYDTRNKGLYNTYEPERSHFPTWTLCPVNVMRLHFVCFVGAQYDRGSLYLTLRCETWCEACERKCET